MAGIVNHLCWCILKLKIDTHCIVSTGCNIYNIIIYIVFCIAVVPVVQEDTGRRDHKTAAEGLIWWPVSGRVF